jgi:hypothetical protein
MRKLLRLGLVAGMSVVAAACQLNGLGFGERGSGNVTTEIRQVSGFTGIVLEGSGEVNIEVTGTESLSIEAEDNIIPHLTSNVVGGDLVLGVDGGISPTRDIVYTITVASLDTLTIDGSGSMTLPELSAGSFGTRINGSGSMDLTGLAVGELTVEISGSGEVTVAGSADSLEVSIPGSGAFSGDDLTAVSGLVEISGSGSAVVDVTDSLEANVSGSGSIRYLGNPTVETDISGSGSVSPVD